MSVRGPTDATAVPLGPRILGAKVLEGEPNWPWRSMRRLAKVFGEPLKSSSFRLEFSVGFGAPGVAGVGFGAVTLPAVGADDFLSSSTADTLRCTGLVLADLASSSFLKSISVVLLWPMRSAHVFRRSGELSLQLRDGCFMGGTFSADALLLVSPRVGVEVMNMLPLPFLGTMGDMLLLASGEEAQLEAAAARAKRSARRMGVA